ncbi:TrfB-related DNA-binding protein [Methylocucumis oryzae]|uniref:TrfB transcriptional repressor protein domain-containing protein n=1 Tax=Methylocucumis oryzae TaxID=1632867 RepID=A0A0F3IN02_9GAMM|nr:TrfB-related DNA-binding protein [Methylocucumis oryzae]KJV08086.1 hypothetical protein VZ94_00570 [Methylocucumis oryzae]
MTLDELIDLNNDTTKEWRWSHGKKLPFLTDRELNYVAQVIVEGKRQVDVAKELGVTQGQISWAVVRFKRYLLPNALNTSIHN